MKKISIYVLDYHMMIYYILINEILENIDEIKCVFLIFYIFHCSETYFPYFHYSPAGLLSLIYKSINII